ncbi:uncharacterized protein LOC119096632 [Pollicipes pollicipes]|uniref:uncharacterized protein LOC119096632 n=1 Tax=Pollicipes pollicipes TaxID=41117 RepID=UPI001885635D|nr:uncharacterized protein LOC119096632 [Pollicipes pollicipes]
MANRRALRRGSVGQLGRRAEPARQDEGGLDEDVLVPEELTGESLTGPQTSFIFFNYGAALSLLVYLTMGVGYFYGPYSVDALLASRRRDQRLHFLKHKLNQTEEQLAAAAEDDYGLFVGEEAFSLIEPSGYGQQVGANGSFVESFVGEGGYDAYGGGEFSYDVGYGGYDGGDAGYVIGEADAAGSSSFVTYGGPQYQTVRRRGQRQPPGGGRPVVGRPGRPYFTVQSRAGRQPGVWAANQPGRFGQALLSRRALGGPRVRAGAPATRRHGSGAAEARGQASLLRRAQPAVRPKSASRPPPAAPKSQSRPPAMLQSGPSQRPTVGDGHSQELSNRVLRTVTGWPTVQQSKAVAQPALASVGAPVGSTRRINKTRRPDGQIDLTRLVRAVDMDHPECRAWVRCLQEAHRPSPPPGHGRRREDACDRFAVTCPSKRSGDQPRSTVRQSAAARPGPP